MTYSPGLPTTLNAQSARERDQSKRQAVRPGSGGVAYRKKNNGAAFPVIPFRPALRILKA